MAQKITANDLKGSHKNEPGDSLLNGDEWSDKLNIGIAYSSKEARKGVQVLLSGTNDQ